MKKDISLILAADLNLMKKYFYTFIASLKYTQEMKRIRG